MNGRLYVLNGSQHGVRSGRDLKQAVNDKRKQIFTGHRAGKSEGLATVIGWRQVQPQHRGYLPVLWKQDDWK